MALVEKRNASRFTVPTEVEQAALRWQSTNYPARLTDQSAGGFGVVVDATIGVQPSETAVLSWSGGCSSVRVVTRVDEEDLCRLGLALLEDLVDATDLDPPSRLWSLRHPRMPLPKENMTYYVTGLLVVLGCVIAGVAWEYMPTRVADGLRLNEEMPSGVVAKPVSAASLKIRTHLSVDEPKLRPYMGNEYAQRSIETKILPKPIRQWFAVRKETLRQTAAEIVQSLPPLPTDAALRVFKDTLASTASAASQAAQAADESTMLAISHYKHLLQITDDQQQKIDAILTAARQATQEIQTHSREIGTIEAMQQIDQIRREAGARALAILSPEQAAEFEKLKTSRHHGAGGVARSEPAGNGP